VGVSTDFLAGPQPVEQWWLVRIGTDGETTRFDAPTAPGEFYRLNDVEVSADGFVFVSGLVGSDGGSTVQGFVRKLDAEGALRWEVRIGDPSAAVGLTDVTFDEHGDLWVTGLTGGVGGPTAGGFDAFFARLDLDGPMPTLAGDESLCLSVMQVDAFEWQSV
jgi:outer membrane protein assembly factor BamB